MNGAALAYMSAGVGRAIEHQSLPVQILSWIVLLSIITVIVKSGLEQQKV